MANSFTDGFVEGSILPRGWRRHLGNALKHKRTGRVLLFHGKDATQRRNEFLRRLNKLEPRKKLTIPKEKLKLL